MQSDHPDIKANIHIREQIKKNIESTNEQLTKKHNIFIFIQTVSQQQKQNGLKDDDARH